MNAQLGNFFPSEKREEWARANLVKGAVLRSYVADIANPKIKRLIIVGSVTSDGKVGKLYINSHPQALHSQISISKDGRKYLDCDSFIDCRKIYEEDLEAMICTLKESTEAYLGRVSEEDLRDIETLLRESRHIPIKQKRRLGFL